MTQDTPFIPHGGADAHGVPLHDFSTNANAAGPCPLALAAVQQADAAHYPDPAYTGLRVALAAFHGVDAGRIVLAASASEFIQRMTACLRLQHGVQGFGARVAVPLHAYGDYAHAAGAWGLTLAARAGDAALIWLCEPSSPQGQGDANWAAMQEAPPHGTGVTVVMDRAYAPLRLSGSTTDEARLQRIWQLFSPNKALGMTGVRGAYAIAPVDAAPEAIARVQALSPSWPLGAHAVAMLTAWTQADVQAWLHSSLHTLRDWTAQQRALCADLGWAVQPSDTNFYIARPPVQNLPALLKALRHHGIKLRDATSFGLPGWVRLGVRAPASQRALREAWHATLESTP